MCMKNWLYATLCVLRTGHACMYVSGHQLSIRLDSVLNTYISFSLCVHPCVLVCTCCPSGFPSPLCGLVRRRLCAALVPCMDYLAVYFVDSVLLSFTMDYLAVYLVGSVLLLTTYDDRSPWTTWPCTLWAILWALYCSRSPGTAWVCMTCVAMCVAMCAA